MIMISMTRFVNRVQAGTSLYTHYITLLSTCADGRKIAESGFHQEKVALNA